MFETMAAMNAPECFFRLADMDAPMARPSKYWLFLSFLFIGLGLCALAWYTRLPVLLWYWPGMAESQNSLGLSAYRAVIEAQPLAGLKNNVSGLAYVPRRGTLFTVTNSPPTVAELTTDGRLLRVIPIAGARDLEGIAHLGDEFFALADEHGHRIYRVRITRQTRHIDVSEAPSLGLDIWPDENRGFEALAWDEKRQRLFVGKEKRPLAIFEIGGLSDWHGKMNLRISQWRAKRPPARFMRDQSSLDLVATTGNLLVLSDESGLLAEYGQDGELFGLMVLWPGWHGLKRAVPQGEGVATDENGNIYIVSEPNLFYRFERQSGPCADTTGACR